MSIDEQRQSSDFATRTEPGKAPKITSIFDFTAETLGQLRLWLEMNLPVKTLVGIHLVNGSKVWDPASIADGAQTSTTVGVVGATLGDPVVASFVAAGGVPAGAVLSASVTAADTVTVTLFNKTGVALDLASGTLRVVLIRA